MENPNVVAVDTSLFDRTVLIRRLLGDEEFARMIVRTFLEDMPRRVTALRLCLKMADAPEVRFQTHTIKGAAGNCTAEQLRETASAMESAAGAGDLETVLALLPELEQRIEKTSTAMKQAFLMPEA